MPVGTFAKLTVVEDGVTYIRPDVSALETPTVRCRYKHLVGESPTTLTYEYTLVNLTPEEINDKKIRAAAIDSVIAALEAGTATNAQAQAALAKVIKYLRARHTRSGETI